MQELVYTALVPHPPIVIPAVGGAESAKVQATQTAMVAMAQELMATRPDTVVIISPHGPVFQDAIAVNMMGFVSGDLSMFGAPEVAFSLEVDQALARLVGEEAKRNGILTAPVTSDRAAVWNAERLDHGTMVPLYYLTQAGWTGPILPIAMGMLPRLQLYRFGQALQRAIDRSGRRVALLASGDLSHRLIPGAPAGYNPQGRTFDQEIVDLLKQGDLARLFNLDHDLCEEAGECGLRPLMMLAGALDGLALQPHLLSYEGPFGVGYAVAPIRPGLPEPERQLYPTLAQTRRQRIEQQRSMAHPIVTLARVALEHYVQTGLQLDFSAGAPHEGTAPIQLPPELPAQAGVFVSLKLDGNLRGCMGSTGPTEPTLALEVVRNAIMAGTEDPRFSAVEEEELPFLDYSVDVLGAAASCTYTELDPQRYGVIVEKGQSRGLLLPNLPGIDTAEEQVSIACQKAGLQPGDQEIHLYRFEVQRFH